MDLYNIIVVIVLTIDNWSFFWAGLTIDIFYLFISGESCGNLSSTKLKLAILMVISDAFNLRRCVQAIFFK